VTLVPPATVTPPSSPPRRRALPLGVLGGGLLALGVLVLLSLALGSNPIGVDEAWRGLIHPDGSREAIIVWQLRMPRTLLAIGAGCALAVAGVLMQALTRNPLAEPGLLGVNAGASFAVVIAISVLGASGVGEYFWWALLGAGLAAGFVHAVSARRSRASDHARLVLAGAALGACLGACTGIITLFDTDAFTSYRLWMVGSVADRGTEPLLALAPALGIGLLLAAVSAPALNALALGDDQATALGVRLPVLRVTTFAAITLLAGAATAAAGPIGFVGLVVPHVLRLLVGVDQRLVLALSAVLGPVLVLGADVLGRLVAPPGELEVGIVTAAIGAPVLLALVLSARSR